MVKKLIALFTAMLMVLALVPAAGFARVEKAEEPAETLKTAQTECIASWGFEDTDPFTEGWTRVDADGDGYNWFWFNNDTWGEPNAYEGDYYMSSNSYSINFTVYPNNWLISPLVEIPDGTTTFSFYAAGTADYNGNDYEEHFAAYICVGDSSSPSSFTEILP